MTACHPRFYSPLPAPPSLFPLPSSLFPLPYFNLGSVFRGAFSHSGQVVGNR